MATIVPRLDLPTVLPDEDCWELHPVISDDDIESEREHRESERRRFAADPTEADIAWWFAETRDDDAQEPDDAHYDAWHAESLGQDRCDRGLCC